jgi:uncharacterized protein
MAIVYLEGDDLQRSFEQLGTSQDPFDVWFRQRAKDVFSGFDLSQPAPGPPSEHVFDGGARWGGPARTAQLRQGGREQEMSQQDVSTMSTAYEAFNRADIPAVLTAMDPVIEWHEPGGGRAPGGTFRGPQSVANEVFSTVPQNFEQFQAQVDHVIDATDRLVVTGHFRGKSKSGQSVDVPFAHVWTMRDGKATSFHNYVDAAPWTKAWGG